MNNNNEISVLKEIKIAGDNSHPNIILDKQNNKFVFSGISIPENAEEFYYSIIEWFERYKGLANPRTEIVFKFDYIDRASSEMIGKLLDVIEAISRKGNFVIVKWYYFFDDEDMLAEGRAFANNHSFPFELINYKI